MAETNAGLPERVHCAGVIFSGRAVEFVMRKVGFFLICMLVAGCAPRPLIRPLKPQEIALARYQEVITAAVAGSLMYEGDCLLFRDDATQSYLLPVWPYGSSFNGTAVLFHHPGKADQRILVSEEFVMEGQALDYSRLPQAYY
jgi:hypothetical protein